MVAQTSEPRRPTVVDHMQALDRSRNAEKKVWPRAALVVSLMFVFVLSLISLALR